MMRRRRFLDLAGRTTGALALAPAELLFPGGDALAAVPASDARAALDALLGEAPCRAAVRTERGGPRLFVNDAEVVPLFGLSTSLLPTVSNFRQMGIRLLQPILGMQSAWLGPDTYDWTLFDDYLGRLLALHPDAFFFPRIQLQTPRWWKAAHPDEVLRYGLPVNPANYDRLGRGDLERAEGGHYFGEFGDELWEASYASEAWRRDTAAMLQAYIRHVEASPLVSRMVGYFIVQGRTSEWNTFGGNDLPDTSAPMQHAAGPVPEPRARLHAAYDLLRDPAVEGDVITFYRRYHETIAETVAYMARATKDAMHGRVLCGTFFAYLLESPRIQEAGYLAPRAVLDSPDIDLIACPYAYQNTNVDGKERWESDMEDGGGNYLGRARGVGGDGAFRALLESIRRRGKLYVSEIDPSTYLDVENRWRSIGGSGSETQEGTLRILRRDFGKVYAEGVGGWLFDFGPIHGVETGWYGDAPIIEEVARFEQLLRETMARDVSPVARIAVAPDTDSFFATRHWMVDKPWPGQGIRYTDLFNHWFLDAQSRAWHRMGAPVAYLHRFDLTPDDLRTFRLLFVPNAFLMAPYEVDTLHDLLRGSGATVVWTYAPGFLRPDRLDLRQMERLTGFRFEVVEAPGPLLIRAEGPFVDDDTPFRFGIKSPRTYAPRFSVTAGADATYGRWDDNARTVAFARRSMDGWTSVYVGTAPLPVPVLRWLAREAGADPWSTRPDVVHATRDAALLVATEAGRRTLTLPHPLSPVTGGPAATVHDLDLALGEVAMFRGMATGH